MQKETEQNPVEMAAKLFVVILIFASLALVLFSCYSENKAQKQQDRVLNKYPMVAVKSVRNRFPFVATGVDSSGFRLAKNQSDSLIKELNIARSAIQNQNKNLFNTTEEYNRRIAELKKQFAETGDRICDSINNDILDFAVKEEMQNVELEKTVYGLRKVIAGFKPIHDTVIDKADVFIANEERDDFRRKYEADHQWRTERELKDAGKIIIRLPWWVIVVLLGLGILSVYGLVRRFRK